MKNKTKVILTIILVYVLAGTLAFAKDYQLDKSEFLSKVDRGEITLEKSPVIPGIPPDLVKMMIESQKKEFPAFKDEMFYAGYVDSNDFRYFIYYEWFNRGCVFGISNRKEFKKVSSDKQGGELAAKEFESYQSIDKKYCEKVLGIAVPDRGLVKVTVPKMDTKKKEKK